MRVIAGSTVAAIVLLGLIASGVAGHAELIASDPPDGSVLDRPPDRLELVFSEAVELDRSSFELADPSGSVVGPIDVTWAGSDHARIELHLPTLSTDTFRLTWRTVSEADLHRSAGTLVYGIGADPAQPKTPSVAALDGPATVLSWLGIAAFCGVVGGIVVWLGLLPGRRRGTMAGHETADLVRRVRSRILTVAIVAALVGAGVAVLTAVTRFGGPDASSLTALTASDATPFLTRTIAVAVLYMVVAGLLAWRRRSADSGDDQMRYRGILAALVVCLAIARSTTGHVGGSEPVTIPAIASATVHAVAAGVWIGGLAILVFAVAPVLRRGAPSAEVATWILRGFAPFAITSAVALLASGLVMAERVILTVDGLLVSDYGHLLIAKVALGVIVAGLGALNASRLHPAAGRLSILPRRGLDDRAARGPLAIGGRSPLRATLVLEASAALTVVALAAILSGTAPAVGARWLPAAAAPFTSRVGQVDDLLVSFTVRPGRPGRNFITVAVHDTRRPAPAPIGAVAVDLRQPVVVPASASPTRSLRPIGDGLYETVVDMPSGGAAWSSTVAVERTGLPTARFQTTWPPLRAAPTWVTQPTIVSSDPIAPTIDAILGVLVAAIVGTSMLFVATRRVAPHPGPMGATSVEAVGGSGGPS